jgi:CHAT domain
MAVPTTPSLRLDFLDDGKVLMVTDNRGKKQPVRCDMSDATAAECRQALKKSLDDMKARLGSTPTINDAAKALGKFHQQGLARVWQLFREDRQKLVDIFQGSHPAWRTNGSALQIEVAARLGQFVPLELLPLFALEEWPNPKAWDLDALTEAARRFLGFSATVRRVYRDLTLSQNLVIDNDHGLLVKCFLHRSLPGAAEEVDFFRGNSACIDMQGPWPDDEFPGEECGRRLAQHLRGGGFNEIQHFCCHCTIDDTTWSASRLSFSAATEATIDHLRATFATLAGQPKAGTGPLIFLNACGASRIDPLRSTSFPRFFLEENGNRGFVGTETNVPDGLAAAFSKRFYRSLLQRLPLGEALYEAKWAMLREFSNPLGLLYIAYADPNLQVKTKKRVRLTR